MSDETKVGKGAVPVPPDPEAVRPEGGNVHVWHAHMARHWMMRAHERDPRETFCLGVAQVHATMAVYEALIEPGCGASVGELAERVVFGG